MSVVAAAISVTGSIVVALIGLYLYRAQASTKRTMQDIHVLVNSRMTEALEKIDRLESYWGTIPGDTPGAPSPKDAAA